MGLVRQNRRKVWNRYLSTTTAAVSTISFAGLTFRPAVNSIVKALRCAVLYTPLAPAGSEGIPVRWSLSGAQNQQLDNAVDGLPGTVFDVNTIWGVNTDDAPYTLAEFFIPAGALMTFQARAFSPAPLAAFALNDVVELFVQMEYEEVYFIEEIKSR